MIKCFRVKCKELKVNYDPDKEKVVSKGEFVTDWYYTAKISSNNPNTLAVLDHYNNWIPFDLYDKNAFCLDGQMIYSNNHYKYYFEIIEEFLIANKKELNKYISNTKFYE